MRIGFDGKRAVQNFTGLGNYSRYVIDILYRVAISLPSSENHLSGGHVEAFQVIVACLGDDFASGQGGYRSVSRAQ